MENAEEKMYSQKTLERKNINSDTIKSIVKTLHGNSPREEEHSKNVSQLSEAIGRTMNLSLELAKYILSHHERWDGSGYPKGLKGEAIPRFARIIALAESYDAMTNDSIFKKAMSKDEAILEIQKNAGSQFDPDIAEIFVEMLRPSLL